jgi:hypothetical protein
MSDKATKAGYGSMAKEKFEPEFKQSAWQCLNPECSEQHTEAPYGRWGKRGSCSAACEAAVNQLRNKIGYEEWLKLLDNPVPANNLRLAA